MTEHLKARSVYPLQFAAAAAAAAQNYAAILAAAPWIRDELGRRCQRIVADNAAPRSKLARLRRLADEIAAAVAPSAICRRGCAHCCHMMLALAEVEAQAISAATGIPVTGHGCSQGEAMGRKASMTLEYWGVPCPFLARGECRIHEHRPIACRLHFSLADSPFFCGTDLAPDESAVPKIDIRPFWQAYAMVTRQSEQGDIRQFFGGAGAAAE